MLHPKASPRIRTSRAWILAPAILIVAAASCDRQGPAGLDDASYAPAFKGKPPPAQIVVDSFKPKEGEQGQTVPMTVYGKGFGNGAKVVFVLDGEDVTTISTSTTSVDETTLTADAEIGLEAVVSADYEVAVSLRGSRGVGTERFEVKVTPNPQSGQPAYRADLYVNPDMDFIDDGDPAYVDGEQRFQAVTESDGDFLVVNFSKQVRRRIRHAWIKLGCMHPADADKTDHTRDVGPSGGPCSPDDYELVEVTDIRAWFDWGDNAREPGQAFFRMPDERFVEVSRCKPLSGQLAPELKFDAVPLHAPDPPTPWLADALAIAIEDPDPGTIRKRRVYSTPDANLAWCQNGYTGAHEFWHVDVDFFVIEHE